MKPTPETRARQLRAALFNLVPEAVPTEYSGRGMYGKTCFAVVLWNPEPVIADLPRWARLSVRRDHMGRDFVIYWPEIPFVKE